MTDYSQYGEQKIIRDSLNKHGETNQWCFEIGAGNGVYLSNTKALRDDGWNAVLIESLDKRFQELISQSSENVRVVHRTVETGSELDAILLSVKCPVRPDVGSIDIDGQDWYLFAGMTIEPRVLVIEFNNNGKHDPEPIVPPFGGEGQANRTAISQLLDKRGYRASSLSIGCCLDSCEKNWKAGQDP